MKLFKKKPQEQQLTRPEALACIPIISPTVSWEILENGDILIEYPLAIKPFFIQLAKRFRQGREERATKKLQLDNMGSAVWQMIDGEKHVKKIITLFAKTSGVTLLEAERSVTAFFRDLGKRGLIIIR
jgi:hypothetical protein